MQTAKKLKEHSLVYKVTWFCGLWLASVLGLAVVSYGIRLLMTMAGLHI